MKKCKSCKIEKLIEEFRAHKPRSNGKIYYESKCKICELENGRKYYKENRRKRVDSSIKCNNKNRSRRRDYDKQYREKNKNILQKKANVRRKKRLKTDIEFKLRVYVSRDIAVKIKKDGSCINYLSYTIKELKQHLESQFKSWMNWNNHGRYNVKKWDDNDQNTWTWQIDHIVPQSDLKYDSMEHENFKKCWSLDNLRPLSAKVNIEDGVFRIRHKR